MYIHGCIDLDKNSGKTLNQNVQHEEGGKRHDINCGTYAKQNDRQLNARVCASMHRPWLRCPEQKKEKEKCILCKINSKIR
jgi:hypothetical protein